MFYSFLKLLLLRPGLFATHLENYLELLRYEAAASMRQYVITAIAWSVCIASFVLCLALAGVAAMLGLVLSTFHWALMVVPLVPLLIACIAASIACRKLNHSALMEIKQQFIADLQALQAAGERRAS